MKHIKYYKIGEVAKITGVPTETIRYWEKRGLLKPARKFGNRRFYTWESIKLIIALKEKPPKPNYKFVSSIKSELKDIIEEIKKVVI